MPDTSLRALPIQDALWHWAAWCGASGQYEAAARVALSAGPKSSRALALFCTVRAPMAFDPKLAAAIDAGIRTLDARQQKALELRYLVRHTIKGAAVAMRRVGYPCNAEQYRSWADQAERALVQAIDVPTNA